MFKLIFRHFVTTSLAMTLLIASGCGSSSESPSDAPTAQTAAADETGGGGHDAGGAHDAGGPHDAGDGGEDYDGAPEDMASDEAMMMAADPAMNGQMNSGMDSDAYAAEMEAQMAAEMSGSDPAMMSQYNGGVAADYGGQYGGAGMPNQVVSTRPADVTTWSDTDLLEAVVERDAAVVTAIRSRAELMQGDPKFVGMMTQVLAANSGGAAVINSGTPGEPGFPRGIDPTALPTDANRPVPPGGASRSPRRLRPPALQNRAVTSLEAMIGESLLSYVPQATQAIRNRMDGIPGSPNQGTTSSGGSTASYEEAMEAQMANQYEQYSTQGSPPTQAYGAGTPGSLPMGNLTDTELLQTVVSSLMINDTDKAWGAISKLVNGDIASPLSPDEVFATVVRAIAEATTLNVAEAEKILAQSIDGSLSSNSTQALKLLTVVGGKATDHYLQLSEPPAAPEPTVVGPGASMANMSSGAMQPSDAMEYEMQAYDGGEEAYGGYAAAGANLVTGTADLPEVNITAAALQPIAGSMWKPEVVDVIAEQLDAADASTSIDLLSVATVVPSDKVRHAMYGLFSRLHELGATGMIQAGLFTNIAKDPGVLNVIKALPRSRGGQSSSRIGGAAVVVDPKESWSDASLNLVLALRERLRNVETNPAFRFEGRQPVPLHDRGVIPDMSMAIETLAPDADALGKAKPSPTRVYYTRLTVSPQSLLQMKDIADHYEKRANGKKHELPSRGILWYDGVKKGSDGTRQSMDVIIEQATAQAAAAFQPPSEPGTIGGGGGGPQQGVGGTGQRFTIEIIVVHTRDPKEGPTKASLAAN